MSDLMAQQPSYVPDRRDAVKSLLQEKSVSATSWAAFLEVTEVTPALVGLRGVANNLNKILSIIAQDQACHLPSQDLMEVCKAILDLTDAELVAIDASLCKADTTGSQGQPMKGLYTTHPLHCLIWHHGVHDLYEGDYIRFKAFFLLTYRRLKDGLIALPEDYETATSFLPSCCLAARKIGVLKAENEADSELIHEIRVSLPRSVGFDDYKKGMLTLLGRFRYPKDSAMVANNTLRNLRNFFREHFPKHKEPGDDDEIIDVLPPPPIEPPNAKTISIEKLEVPTEPTVVTIISPTGKSPVGQVIRIRSKTSKYSTGTDKFEYIAHRDRVNALAMANQNLPWSWDRLSDYEVEALWQTLTDMERFADCLPSELTVDTQELRAFLAFSFFAGRGSSVFCSVSLSSGSTADNEEIRYGIETGLLEFPTYAPQEKELSGKHGSRPHSRRLALKLHPDLRNILSSLLNQRPGHTALSYSAPATLETAATSWLTRFNGRNDTRATLGKIREHLYRNLTSSLDSDEAIAVAITGNLQGGGYHPASYQALHPAVLQRHYELVFSNGPVPREIGIPLSEMDPHVGSAKVPRTMVVRALGLKFRYMLNWQSMFEYHQPFAEIHNTFIIYSYLLLGFATGFRPVINPVGHAVYFATSTNELVLSEKDRPNFAHCRPVWLPKVAVEQFHHLLDHLKHLESRLVLFDPQLAGGGLAMRQEFPIISGNRKADIDAANDVANFMFLINDTGGRTLLSPATVNDWLLNKQLGSLHDNAWRQGYRTALRESGCPDRIVRAAMGHWRSGEEAFYRFSALLPDVYRRELDAHISGVMKRIAWDAVASPFVRQL